MTLDDDTIAAAMDRAVTRLRADPRNGGPPATGAGCGVGPLRGRAVAFVALPAVALWARRLSPLLRFVGALGEHDQDGARRQIAPHVHDDDDFVAVGHARAPTNKGHRPALMRGNRRP